MRNIVDLKKRHYAKMYTYLDKDRNTLEVIIEWTPEEGINAYTEVSEFDMSAEQIDDMLKLVAEESYKMGKEHLDDWLRRLRQHRFGLTQARTEILSGVDIW